MNKRKEVKGITKRLMNAEELQTYLGIGRAKSREFADEIGATKRFGARVVFDKVIIDRALDGIDLG